MSPMTEFFDRTERAFEYPSHTPASGYTDPGCDPGCLVCDGYDELRCARGRYCVAGTATEGVARIGEWLGINRDRPDVDEHRSAAVFVYETMPTIGFCEDCVAELDDPDNDVPSEPVLHGIVGELFWTVTVDNVIASRRFAATVMAFDRTGGMTFESEVGAFATLAAAETYARTEAERLNVADLDAEWAAGIHRDHNLEGTR